MVDLLYCEVWIILPLKNLVKNTLFQPTYHLSSTPINKQARDSATWIPLVSLIKKEERYLYIYDKITANPMLPLRLELNHVQLDFKFSLHRCLPVLTESHLANHAFVREKKVMFPIAFPASHSHQSPATAVANLGLNLLNYSQLWEVLLTDFIADCWDLRSEKRTAVWTWSYWWR